MSKSLLRASSLAMLAFAGAGVLDYLFVTTMSWMLPPKEYGILGVASTWFLLLSFFVASGFPMSLAKFLSERHESPPGLVRFAVRANLVLALVVVALFLGLTFYGPLSPGPGYGRLVWAVALAVLLLAVGGTLQFALQGRLAFGSFALLHASKSLNKLVFGAALVMLGFGVAGSVGGLVAGGVVLVVAAWWLLRKHAPDALVDGDVPRETRRRFLAYTLTVFAGSFALTLLMSLDLLGVKYLAPPGDSDLFAAHYQVATILTKAPLWAVLASLSVLFPLLSRAAAREPAAASKLLQKVLRWMLLALAPLTLALAAFPGLVLGVLFPRAYADAAPVLAVSAVGMAALALTLVLTRALQATGRTRVPGAALVVSVALQAALLVAWVPRYGALGAALATAAGSFAGCALVLAAAARPFRLRVGARDVVSLVVSLAAMAAVVEAVRPQGRVAVVLTFAAALASYAACIVLLGLVRPRERRAMIRRVLPRALAPEPEAASAEA